MNPEIAKVIIVTSNICINDALAATISDFSPDANIHSYTDEYEALWNASGFQPDIVILWYGPKSGSSCELLKRLRLSLKKFLGILVYDTESEEYESALFNVIEHDPEYAGILPVRIDMFEEKIEEIFHREAER